MRVACPARGTLLADGRTDLFLSLMLRSIQLALGGLGTFWFDHFAGAREVAGGRARRCARRCPGLEAMIPGSRAHARARPLPRAPTAPPGLTDTRLP